MDHGTRDDLTALLEAARAGGEDTKDRLVRAAYGELRRMAAGFMRRERTDHTLQPSALVNEAVIRLLDGGALVKAQDRRHLFAAAAQAMRQALVDHARTRGAAKRAGGRGRVPWTTCSPTSRRSTWMSSPCTRQSTRLIVAGRASGPGRCPAVPRRVVHLRGRRGLDVSAATVEGDWRVARAWLRGQLGGEVE